MLSVRRELIESRTRAISLARAITRAAGLRIRGGRTEMFLDRLGALELPETMRATLVPLRSAIDTLNQELATADERFTTLAADDPVATRLMTMPSIGPITASAFVAALDDATRFDNAAQVTSYLGLVPREYSSGERQHRGHVLRSAHPQVQSLLIQAAWRMMRSRDARTAGLRAWADAIAGRRGKRVAMVALARRLARILFAMWRDQVDYQPDRIREDGRRPARSSHDGEAAQARVT